MSTSKTPWTDIMDHPTQGVGLLDSDYTRRLEALVHEQNEALHGSIGIVDQGGSKKGRALAHYNELKKEFESK